MRSMLAVSALLIVSLIVPIGFAGSDAVDTGLVLYEVDVYNEGVSLHNYSDKTIDLRDYVISDNPSKKSNEGTITFTSSINVAPGGTVTLMKKSVEDCELSDRYTTYYNGQKGVTFSSQFALKDKTDDVYLFYKDTVIDSFQYGSASETDDPSWEGEAFSPRKGFFVIRKGIEGGSASCWYNYRAGMTTYFFDPSNLMDATVEPFLFPEHGGIPIYKALEQAKESVYITMYMFGSQNMYALLCELASEGVEVKLLLEGSPLLGDNMKGPLDYADLNQALVDAGGDVRLIGTEGNDRFKYVHAKYCIIDGETVILGSENWTTDNLNMKVVTDPTKGAGNRGWGIIVHSDEYASFMTGIFENDYDMSYGDVDEFTDLAPYAKAKDLSYKAPTAEVKLQSYQVKINPCLSPDSSLDAMMHYMRLADSRLYAEQHSIADKYYGYVLTSPLKAMDERSAAGVDTRLVLGSNNDDYNIINLTSQIKTAMMTDPYVHNKGIIADDVVIVSSVNWTVESISQDREVLLVILSKEVADYYNTYLVADFDRNYKYSGLQVAFTEISDKYDGPGAKTFSVSVTQSGKFSYLWDLDGKTTSSSEPRVVMDVQSGEHVLKVTVTDSSGNIGTVSKSFTVEQKSSSFDGLLDKIEPYLVPIIIVIIALILSVMRMGRGR